VSIDTPGELVELPYGERVRCVSAPRGTVHGR
jgi:hypothetical protein